MEDQELDFEPEWCEDCSMEAEENRIEYEFYYYIEDGFAYCEHCNKPL